MVSGPLIDQLRADPADAVAHALLGDAYAARKAWVRAAAQYRTALALGSGPVPTPGAEQTRLRANLAACLDAEGSRPAGSLTHNIQFRTQWLGDRLRELYPSGAFSLLDAGGGEGRLCLELPGADYVLAEPTTNGLFVDAGLSFGRTFDAVVCCHVVEHIPRDGRDTFLDVLCGMAGDRVLLLGPVEDPHTDLRTWQQVIYDVTGGMWAKEHMDCDMPSLADLTSYAERRGYRCTVRPNGSKLLALALVFFDHYSRGADPGNVVKINQMFNALSHEDIDSADWPNAWLVQIETGG